MTDVSVSARDAAITVRQLYWMTLLLVTVSAPLMLELPWWISLLAVVLIAWRYFSARMGFGLMKRRYRVMLIVCTLATVLNSYGTVAGRDAGVALLLLMLALKLLEIRTEREALVFLFLNYFLVVTHFLFTQSIPVALYALVCVLGITVFVIRLQQGAGTRPLRHTLALTLKLFAQALPTMLILFVLFPRLPSPFWKSPGNSQTAKSGLSEIMRPGDINQLIRSHAIAFRVKFDTQAPPRKKLYWRGPVLRHFDSRNWYGVDKTHVRTPQRFVGGRVYSYTIMLEPHQQHILPALDIPTEQSRGYQGRDLNLWSPTDITERIQYTLVSHTDVPINQAPSAFELQAYLRIPKDKNPQTQAHALRLRQAAASPAKFVETVLHQFREQEFAYTLNPPTLGAHSIDDFLFRSRRGFCEHYASAFVVLMRLGGVPARVVTGYQGGEFNPLGDYYIVRQSDAHAWAEIWLKDQGWVRVDPTGYIAPSRIERGIDASFSNEPSWAALRNASSSWGHQFELYWDSANRVWNQWILGYGEGVQEGLLRYLGLDGTDWPNLVLVLISLLALAFCVLALYYHLRNKKNHAREEYVRLYALFCTKLHKHGLTRHPWEGPQSYAHRVSTQRPELTDITNRITALYINLAFTPNTKTKQDLRSLRYYVKQNYFRQAPTVR